MWSSLAALLVTLSAIICYSLAIPVVPSHRRFGQKCGANGSLEDIPSEAALIDRCQFPPKRGSRWRNFCSLRITIDPSSTYYCTAENLSNSSLLCYRSDQGHYTCECSSNSTSHKLCFLYVHTYKYTGV